jgi:hypothetical protein
MFMTYRCIAPNRDSHVHLPNRAVSATALAVLLTVSVGCARDGGQEIATRPAKDPIASEVEDAGMQCPKFDDDYRSDFKGCVVDGDCEVADVEFGCRGKRGIYGVATATRDEFDRCLPNTDLLRTCSTRSITRAEDGRVTAPDLHDVHARCIEASCQARIEERICGSSETVCAANQLCTSYQDAMGLTQFVCLDNPCLNQRLDCKCAAPVCSVPADRMRSCAVDLIEDSDVYCKAILR